MCPIVDLHILQDRTTVRSLENDAVSARKWRSLSCTTSVNVKESVNEKKNENWKETSVGTGTADTTTDGHEHVHPAANEVGADVTSQVADKTIATIDLDIVMRLQDDLRPKAGAVKLDLQQVGMAMGQTLLRDLNEITEASLHPVRL
jgi:hypothetical protein